MATSSGLRRMLSTSTLATPDWNTTNYLRFADERTRPARDLVAAIPLQSPKSIVDLGCGPANSTSVLASRYANVEGIKIVGVDSSSSMLEKARKVLPEAEFELADLTTYVPRQGEGPVDLLFSNAALHWLPDSKLLPVMKKLVRSQISGGVFAMQVPDNVREPSHVLMSETARDGPWAEVLASHNPARPPFPEPTTLYNELQPLCASIDIWHTCYHHRLEGHEAIVSWLKESGLRPFLQPLEEDMQKKFLNAYLEKIKMAYPLNNDGSVLLRFPRLFLVCVRV